MKRKNMTRNALITSIISILLCVSMLVGATFAWFTDEVVTGMNTIAAGNLDIELYAGDTQVKADTKLFDDVTLWEPGVVVYEDLQIVNAGTLALKYEMSLNFGNENTLDGYKLSEVLQAAIIDKIADGATREEVLAAAEGKGTKLVDFVMAGELEPGAETDAQTVVIFWAPNADEIDNLYNAKNGKKTSDGQPLHIEFGINLQATQLMYEEDSFGKDYDKFAGKTVVTPEDAQAAIWAAEEGDVIYLSGGAYDTLVLENEDGSPKKGITIEHEKPGNNYTSDPFSVGQINLNSSEDIKIYGIYFDIDKAEPAYGRNGANGYKASIVGSKQGANIGAKNIVIEYCRFSATSNVHEDYVAICFEEQGKPTSRATDITVKNCYLDKSAFNFVRANYLAKGTVTIEDNSLIGGTTHSALNFTGNAADLIIKNNSFGVVSMSGHVLYNGWNPEKAMLGTSRQGNNKILVEVTGNTFNNVALVEGEGHVVELKSSYTQDNCELVFEGNTFGGELAGMTETTVPCIWHN